MAPEVRGEPSYRIESFPEGNYRDRDTESVKEEDAERAYASEVKRIMAVRITEEEWTPIVVRILDGGDLEVKRTVVK